MPVPVMSPCGLVCQRMLREGLYGLEAERRDVRTADHGQTNRGHHNRGRQGGRRWPLGSLSCPHLRVGGRGISQTSQASGPLQPLGGEVPLPSWATDVAFWPAPVPRPLISVWKLLQWQREFTLSLEDTKTWNKRSLIINAFFLAGIKSSPGTFEASQGAPVSLQGRNADRPGGGAGRPWLWWFLGPSWRKQVPC